MKRAKIGAMKIKATEAKVLGDEKLTEEEKDKKLNALSYADYQKFCAKQARYITLKGLAKELREFEKDEKFNRYLILARNGIEIANYIWAYYDRYNKGKLSLKDKYIMLDLNGKQISDGYISEYIYNFASWSPNVPYEDLVLWTVVKNNDVWEIKRSKIDS